MEQKQSKGFGLETKEFGVGFIPHKTGRYRIEIDDVITEVAQFSSAIMVLEAASEEDEVEIILQCDGGNVNATDAFIHAMTKCSAPIHVVATGGCHSAATHILLAADSFELSKGFNALLHCGSDGAYGGANEYRIKSKFDEVFRVQQFRDIYEGFLTEDEIDAMLDGKDIWLDGEQWCERAMKRMAYYQAKMEAEEAANTLVVEKPKKPRKPLNKAVDTAN